MRDSWLRGVRRDIGGSQREDDTTTRSGSDEGLSREHMFGISPSQYGTFCILVRLGLERESHGYAPPAHPRSDRVPRMMNRLRP